MNAACPMSLPAVRPAWTTRCMADAEAKRRNPKRTAAASVLRVQSAPKFGRFWVDVVSVLGIVIMMSKVQFSLEQSLTGRFNP